MNNFTIKSFAPYSLNYLIYIQNAFINNKGQMLVTEETLFQKLFKPDDQGKEGFEESRKSFYAWFSSLAGQFTFE